MTAKEVGAWYEYEIDLRDYQGQDIYVAIVHFNCSNQFMVNVDDILLRREFDGVNESNANTFAIYPNPASDKVVVEGEVIVNQYSIYNVAGAMIMNAPVGEKSFEVNVRYCLRLFV